MPTFEEHLVNLQQTNAQLVHSNNELTQEITEKLGDINQKVRGAEQSMTEFAEDLLKHRIVGGNLLMDPWLFNTVSEIVDGAERRIPNSPPFLPRGEAQLKVVSQDNFAFGTRYHHLSVKEAQLSQPENFTDDPWLASPEKPIFAHLRHKQIMSSGGLKSPEWSGLKQQGFISKITIPRQSSTSPNSASIGLNVGKNLAFTGGRFLFRAWIHVKKGTLIFGNHSGYNRSINGQIKLPSTQFQPTQAAHPFQFIEFVIETNRYCGNALNQQNFASGDNDLDLECFIASPQLFALDDPDDMKKPMTGETFGGSHA
jgi:hypothetical protein